MRPRRRHLPWAVNAGRAVNAGLAVAGSAVVVRQVWVAVMAQEEEAEEAMEGVTGLVTAKVAAASYGVVGTVRGQCHAPRIGRRSRSGIRSVCSGDGLHDTSCCRTCNFSALTRHCMASTSARNSGFPCSNRKHGSHSGCTGSRCGRWACRLQCGSDLLLKAMVVAMVAMVVVVVVNESAEAAALGREGMLDTLRKRDELGSRNRRLNTVPHLGTRVGSVAWRARRWTPVAASLRLGRRVPCSTRLSAHTQQMLSMCADGALDAGGPAETAHGGRRARRVDAICDES